MDGLTYYAADLAARRMPRQPFLLLGQMTTADASRSPSGTESAWCYTHVPVKPDLTGADVAEHVERIEQAMERHAPGFRDLILDRSVQSPADLEHSDANLVGGAINGGTANLHQQLIFRPIPGLGRPDTVIDRLFLASSSAHPGGGVHGGPGHNAAIAALRRSARTGALRRRVLDFAMDRVYR
jgi:phytoene dehydrogenase-like protein